MPSPVGAAPRSWPSSRSSPHPPASPPLRRRFATPPPPPLRGVEDSPPPALTPILQPHAVGWRCRAQRGGGGTPPGRSGTVDVRHGRHGEVRSDFPAHRRAEDQDRSPPLRHPGTASKRSAGRRIRDPCLAGHARDPVRDEADAAARQRHRHGRRRILQRRPPLRRRFATPPPPPLRGVEYRLPPAPTPIPQPHAVGGGAERSEAEGGTPPVRSGTVDVRHGRHGEVRSDFPAHRRAEDQDRSPPLRHPGTASERSAGRRIRDPCLAGHARDPVRDEARAVARSRRSTVVAASSSVVPPLRRRFATPPPPPLRGVEDRLPPALSPILQPHAVGWRCRAQRGGGGTPPGRSGTVDVRHDGCGEVRSDFPAHRRAEDQDRSPPLRHPGTASKRSAGRRIRDPCLAGHARDPVRDEADAAARQRRRHGRRRIPQRGPPSVVASRRHLRPHCVGWRTGCHRR